MLKLDRPTGQFRAVDLPYKGTLFGVSGNARAVSCTDCAAPCCAASTAARPGRTSTPDLQVGLTASTVDAEGRFVIVSQAGHVLMSADDGATFQRAEVERPLPAAAVAAIDRNLLVVAGPRGVDAKTLR